MAKENNISSYTALDIEKYHKGLLSPAERHRMEEAALEDPFLADALEGYAFAGNQLGQDLSELTRKITAASSTGKLASLQPGKKTFSPFLRVAAMLLLLAGAGILVYQFAFNSKDTELAHAKPAVQTAPPAVSPPADSSPVHEKAISVAPPVASTTVKNNTAVKELPSSPEAPVNPPVQPAPAPASGRAHTSPLERNEPGAAAVNTDTRTAGGGNLKQAPAPVKAEPVNTEDVKQTETERAKEESKSRAIALKKQESAQDDAFKKQNRVASEDKSRKETARQQTRDGYYNDQSMNTFRGRVTDPNNVGLPFANVTNLSDNVGTYTDANGNFILTSPDTVLTVQIRSMGYDPNNSRLRSDVAANTITLQEDRNNLSEQVIVSARPNTAARAREGNRRLIEPEPVDGWVKYDSYLANNLNVPDDFKQQNNTSSNSVELSFEVDKNGEPVNIRIEKSLCAACDKEAIRLVKEGPKWKRTAAKKGRTRVTINF